MKLRYFAFLTCLLLIVAAVDTIPDPYAINPPSGHSSGIFVSHIRAISGPLEKERYVVASLTLPNQINWDSCEFDFDILPNGHLVLPRVHHAADVSPPVFS